MSSNKEADIAQILKNVKNKCSELDISLIFDKIENDGGLCKYRNKIFIVINKFYTDHQKLSIFFNEIERAELNADFEELKKQFLNIK